LDLTLERWSAARMHRDLRSATDRSSRILRLAATAAVVALLSVSMSSGCTGPGGPGPSPTSAPVPAEPTCEDGTLDGRRFILCTAGDTPDQHLVVALHGRGSSAEEMQAATELDRYASARGLAVVFPNALDGGWGDDTFATPTRPSGFEDVTALSDLIDHLRIDERIDDHRPIALVGFSNGASMAMRYAAQGPEQVRAVVSVAGQLPRDPAIRPGRTRSGCSSWPSCSPETRTPLLEIYGTADPIRPYDTGIPDPPVRQPGGPTPTLSTMETVETFVAVAGTPADHEGPAESDPDPTDGTSLRTERWRSGADTLAVLHTVVGGGHTWPSAKAPFTGGERFGPISEDLDASAEAVDFVVDAG
jgi:polyhydroxybutyrate depolymerase